MTLILVLAAVALLLSSAVSALLLHHNAARSDAVISGRSVRPARPIGGWASHLR